MNSQKKFIIGIIVTYNPQAEFFENFHTYSNEVDYWILFDNGSNPETQYKISKLCKDFKNLSLKLSEINLGLAEGQNQSIILGMQKGGSHFYFLDQDSVPSKGSVPILLSFLNSSSLGEKSFGMVGSNVVHRSGKTQKYWIKNKFGILSRIGFGINDGVFKNVIAIISSGSLIPISIFQCIGLFRSDFFIDYIDIDFSLRVRKAGFRIGVSKSASIEHSIGEASNSKLRGIFYPTNHSPIRRFYKMRNRIWVWKAYCFIFPDWFLVDLGTSFFDTIRILIFEKNRSAQCRAMLDGLIEGFAKKSRLPNVN